MFLLREIGTCHLAFIEIAYRGILLEIACLGKSEVVRIDVVIIVHHYPAIFADTFPTIRSLMSSGYAIVIVIIHGVGTIDRGRCCMFDGGSSCGTT